MKAVSHYELCTRIPEMRKKAIQSTLKQVEVEYRRSFHLVGFGASICLFLNMTWVWTGTIFEIRDERNKRRDERPAWRSHRTQGKRAAGAELEDQISLAVIWTKSYPSTDYHTEACHTHEQVVNIALKVQDRRTVFLSASSSLLCY